MMSTRAQSAAAASRQNSPQGENSGETQSTSPQNSPVGENPQTSSQNLLTISPPLNRQPTRSIFEDTEDTMSTTSVLVKAGEIAPLNGSAD
jgi:heme-binding NEAT domain protein